MANDEEDEYAVKVGYIYNFCNYVRWPNPVTPEAFTVGVLGPALQAPDVVATIRELHGQIVANRKIVLREFATIEKNQPCDMIFVTGSESSDPNVLARVAKITSRKSVLIVSEVADELKQGATINFVRVGRTVKLEIKQSAAKAASLVINAKLLRLAINYGSRITGCGGSKPPKPFHLATGPDRHRRQIPQGRSVERMAIPRLSKKWRFVFAF